MTIRKTLRIFLSNSILFVFLFSSINTEANQIKYLNPKKYCITYSFFISSDNSNLTSLEIWMPLPKSYDSQKNISIKSIKPKKYIVKSDHEEKTKIVYWRQQEHLKGHLEITFLEQIEYDCYEIKSVIDYGSFTPYSEDNKEYIRCTISEKHIESDNPLISKKGREIVGDERNPYKKAKMIYDWIINYMHWKDVEGLQGALFALENGFGECGDYSALFCALCRSVGIPSRPVVGFQLEEKGKYHVWSEFYIENLGWIPVDVNLGDYINREYYFGNLDNRRFICSKSFNVFLEPNIRVNPIALFQLPYLWYSGSGDLKAEHKFEYTTIPNN